VELSNEFEVGVGIDEAWAVLTDLEQIAPCLPGATLTEVVEVDGVVHHRGKVKVKLGPIQATYQGEAHIVEADPERRTVLLLAAGREARGSGNASASIRAQLSEREGADGPRTHVSLVTDLSITGRVAQFGRGVLGDVSAKLLTQLVANLEATVLAEPQSQSEPEPEVDLVETVDLTVVEVVDLDTGEEVEVIEVTDTVEVVDAGTGEVLHGAAATEAVEALAGAAGERPAGPRSVGPVAEAEPIDLLDTAGAPMLRRALPVAGLAVTVLVVVRVLRRRRRRR
jgi:carbon monoxide dehydrogenase subunit G